VSRHCCAPDHGSSPAADPRYRRVLWIALVVNAAMFAVEIGASLASNSVSLLADAADFAGDAANYGLSLAVLSLGLAWRARAALVKGWSMGIYGILVLARVGYGAFLDLPPEAATMGAVALLALAANLSVAALLYAYRTGDANMRSVWLCTRNDAIGNVAVIIAALGVAGTGNVWPDLAVAAIMSLLGLAAARSVILQARHELEPAH
jgi:Co/Zn/Cd efflux system component